MESSDCEPIIAVNCRHFERMRTDRELSAAKCILNVLFLSHSATEMNAIIVNQISVAFKTVASHSSMKIVDWN